MKYLFEKLELGVQTLTLLDLDNVYEVEISKEMETVKNKLGEGFQCRKVKLRFYDGVEKSMLLADRDVTEYIDANRRMLYLAVNIDPDEEDEEEDDTSMDKERPEET